MPCEICGGAHPTEVHLEAEKSKAQLDSEGLIQTSRELIEACGFEPDKTMPISELKALQEQNQEKLQTILEQAYASDNAEATKMLASSPEVRLAYLMNIQKMVEFNKTRKDGSPYYIHPQSASQKLLEHAPAHPQILKEGIIGALLHDYLEEGAGVTTDAVDKLKDAFGDLGNDFAEDLAVLTEPYYLDKGVKERPEYDYAIDYDALRELTGQDRKTLETVLFGIIMEASRTMQLVVPVDKLDNVGDCDEVQRKKVAKKIPDASSEEYRAQLEKNIANKLGTYGYYGRNCTLPESDRSRVAMQQAVEAKLASLSGEFPGLREKVEDVINSYADLQRDETVRTAIIDQLTAYYGDIEANSVVDKLEAIR